VPTIKYWLLFVFPILILSPLAGCGGGSGGSSSSFNPPGWIQGQWGVSGEGTVETIFEFTNNNVIQYAGETKISFKDIYKDVKENITSTLYEFTINYGTTTFSYSKNADGTLTFIITGSSDTMTLVKKN
jgi:hypothetical protein